MTVGRRPWIKHRGILFPPLWILRARQLDANPPRTRIVFTHCLVWMTCATPLFAYLLSRLSPNRFPPDPPPSISIVLAIGVGTPLTPSFSVTLAQVPFLIILRKTCWMISVLLLMTLTLPHLHLSLEAITPLPQWHLHTTPPGILFPGKCTPRFSWTPSETSWSLLRVTVVSAARTKLSAGLVALRPLPLNRTAIL